MTTTTVTLTGDVSDAIAENYDPSRTKVYVRHNTDTIVTDSGPIRLGAGTENVGADGTFTLPNVVAETSLVENLQATVVVDYADTSTRQRKQATFGPYDLTGLTGSVDIRDLEEVQALDASRASVLMSEMEALRDESAATLEQQEDLSGIATPDAAVAYLIDNPSATKTSLTASTVQRVETRGSSTPGAQKKLREIVEPGHTASKWSEWVDGGSFEGVLDPTWFFGWNAGGAIGVDDAGEAAIYMGMEARYVLPDDRPTVEWYVGVKPDNPGGGYGIFRPFYVTAGRDDDDKWAQVSLNIGSDAGGQFDVLAGDTGDHLLSMTTAFASFSVPLRAEGDTAQVVVGDGVTESHATVIINPGPASSGRIRFFRNGAQSFSLYDAYENAYFYLRDEINGVALVEWAAGPGLTGAMNLKGKLQVEGNVGFYGTAAVAKQTGVAVSAAGVHAALVNLGLISA